MWQCLLWMPREQEDQTFFAQVAIYIIFFPSRANISFLDVMNFWTTLKYITRGLSLLSTCFLFIRKNFWNPSYFFKNILSIYICILVFRFLFGITISLQIYILNIFKKKVLMYDFFRFFSSSSVFWVFGFLFYFFSSLTIWTIQLHNSPQKQQIIKM